MFEPDPLPLFNPEEIAADRSFEVTRENETFYVEADWLEGILRMVDVDDYESLQHFQLVLKSTGIIAKLEEMGIREGNTVSVCGYEFDYVN